jgi:hypothetical protein
LDQAGLDCLGASPFPFENPRFEVLDFLGFPWILSSETRLTNGLRGIFLEKFFPRLFASALAAGTGCRSLGESKRRVAHRGSLAFFLIFCKTLPPAGFAHVSYNSVEEAHGRAERGLPVTLVIGKDDCEVAAAPAVTAAESIRDFSRP